MRGAGRKARPYRDPFLRREAAESFLPRFLRAGVTRTAGLAIAALAVMGLVAGWWPANVGAVAFVGVLPEVLVRLQDAGRRLAVAQRRSDS